LLVRAIDTDMYEIVAGARRYLAARLPPWNMCLCGSSPFRTPPVSKKSTTSVKKAAQNRSILFIRPAPIGCLFVFLAWHTALELLSNHGKVSVLLHALSHLPKQPRSSQRDLRATFSCEQKRTLLYEQIKREHLLLHQKITSLSGELSQPSPQLKDQLRFELAGSREHCNQHNLVDDLKAAAIAGLA
jgi:hypothetical protein